MLTRYAHVRAVGLAGMSRSMSPDEMERTLPDAFAVLAKLRPKFVHYKVCSTFDSSPNVGCIGRAIDIGARVFSNRFIPLVVGAPALGRYCVFGNLFARCGSDAALYRLDRHPSMSRHPVTPMTESDLRVHLAQQTQRPVELIDVITLERGPAAVETRLHEMASAGECVALFDALNDAHLALIGEIVSDVQQREGKSLFVVGSSGVEAALTKHWRSAASTASANSAATARAIKPVDRAVAVSGSCSPVTARQIEWAVKRGFAELPLDTARLLATSKQSLELNRVTDEVARRLDSGRSVIVHTSRGPQDPRLAAVHSLTGPTGETAARLGVILGRILRDVLRIGTTGRVAVVGGDTSGHVAEALSIEALEVAGPLAAGVPLCIARSADRAIDGLEIAFKGGQVGGEDFFQRLLNGG